MNLQMATFCIVSLMLGHKFMSSLYNPLFHHNFRRSHPEVFCKKLVLRNFAKFTGKHLCQSCKPHQLYWLWLNFIRLIVIFTQCNHFYNLKNVKNAHGGLLLLATLLKLTLLYGCFSRFLNCTNSTKWRETSQMIKRVGSQKTY